MPPRIGVKTMTTRKPSRAAIRAAERYLLGTDNPLAISVKTLVYFTLLLTILNTVAIIYLLAR